MNLISCSDCGCVFDKNKLFFYPYDDYDDEYEEKKDLREWDGDKFISYLQCPVCPEGKLLDE